MKVEVVKSSTSERDYAGLLDYFAAIDDGLARRFMKAVDDTVQMIAEFLSWVFLGSQNVLGFEISASEP